MFSMFCSGKSSFSFLFISLFDCVKVCVDILFFISFFFFIYFILIVFSILLFFCSAHLIFCPTSHSFCYNANDFLVSSHFPRNGLFV